MKQIDCIVAGAGVVGLAIARALAARGLDTLILEKADAIGTETSSSNSEVIHAGIYYPNGSLKAKLCVEGRAMLYRYVADHGVAHARLGKLIVGTAPGQERELARIADGANRCGVHDLVTLDGAEACVFSWNRDPALGVIFIQSGPRG